MTVDIVDKQADRLSADAAHRANAGDHLRMRAVLGGTEHHHAVAECHLAVGDAAVIVRHHQMRLEAESLFEPDDRGGDLPSRIDDRDGNPPGSGLLLAQTASP